jgi:multidrug efflux system membrane fusion protein
MSRIVGLTIALAALALTACGDEPPALAQTATPVRAALSSSGPAAPAILTTGRVETSDEMRLSFKVGGVIREIAVEAGDRVRKGQRLAQIELAEVASQVSQARETAAKAQRDLARGERLYADQVISLEQLEAWRTGAAVAQAQLDAAEFNRSHAVIVAPRDGTVLQRLAEERELVPAGEPVLVLGAEDRGFVVSAALSDREVVQLAASDAVEVRTDAFPGKVIAGHVSEIATAADRDTGLFPIEVRLEQTELKLVTGLVAKVAITPSTARRGALTYVPIAAVVEGDGRRASVFVVEGAKVRRQDVEVAFIGPDSVALTSGLAPGVRVVTDGALYLEDGETIEIVSDADRGGAVAGAREPLRG